MLLQSLLYYIVYHRYIISSRIIIFISSECKINSKIIDKLLFIIPIGARLLTNIKLYSQFTSLLYRVLNKRVGTTLQQVIYKD